MISIYKKFLSDKKRSAFFQHFLNILLILVFCFCPLKSFSLELETKKFVICQQKRATGIHFRTIRIHKISEKGSDQYFTIYTQQGQDEIVAQGKWLVFCEKIANQVETNLKKYLWTCEEQKNIKVFYSDETLDLSKKGAQPDLKRANI